MQPLRNIAVIACDQGLLRSLVFSLDVAGFNALAYDALPASGLAGQSLLMTIVDADAWRRDPGLRAALEALNLPFVYLADDRPPFPSHPKAAFLMKPFQGPDLLALVEAQARPLAAPARAAD